MFRSLRDYVNAQPRTITQTAIAQGMGLSDTMMSAYLSQRAIPSRNVALRLSRAYGISLVGLLDPASVDPKSAQEPDPADDEIASEDEIRNRVGAALFGKDGRP
jgi:transcriptional regulator with XRE-family HTH domain